MAGWFLAVAIVLGGGCESPRQAKARVPAYDTAAFGTTLVKGVSTRADVEKALGKPNGSGEMWFPTTERPEDAWFYQLMQVSTAGGKIDVQMDMMVVFFKGEVLDGYIWLSDADETWRGP